MRSGYHGATFASVRILRLFSSWIIGVIEFGRYPFFVLRYPLLVLLLRRHGDGGWSCWI